MLFQILKTKFEEPTISKIIKKLNNSFDMIN